MAFASKVTIGTGNKITQSYQSQDVSVSVTYELERTDTDLLAFMAEKADEVEACHTTVWRGIYAKRAERGIATGETGASEQSGGTPASAEQAQPRRARKAGRTAETDPAQSQPPVAIQGAASDESQATPAAVPPPQKEEKEVAEAAPASPDQSQGGGQTADLQVYEPASNVQKIAIRHLAARKGYTPDSLASVLKEIYGKASLDDMTKPEAVEFLAAIQKGALDQPAEAVGLAHPVATGQAA